MQGAARGGLAMTNMERFAAGVRKGEAYVVDQAGGVHVLSWAAYAEMPSAELAGCHVYTTLGGALNCAARIWRERQAKS